MLTLLKSLFASDDTAAPSPARPRLGGGGITLEAREVPSITPAQIAAIQVTPASTVAALAAAPVNQTNADTAVKDARTVLTAISGSGNPVDVQNRVTINSRLTTVSVEKAQYDAARVGLQGVLNAYGAADAAYQMSFPFQVPDVVLAQQRATVSSLTAKLNTEAAELKAATGALRSAVFVVYGGTSADATNPTAVRVANLVTQANADLLRGGAAWQVADQMVTAGVIRYQQIMSQVGQLEALRMGLMGDPFTLGQGLAVQAQMTMLRQQADRIGANLVVVQQAMTRQYEAWYGLQTAVERAKDTRTATTVPELVRREADLIIFKANLAAQTPTLQSSVSALSASF